MKKFLLVLILFLGMASGVRAEASLTFCETFNNDFQPQNVGATFPGPGLSLILFQDKPFAVPALTLTIYKKSGKEESLMDRAEFNINPEWTAYGIRHLTIAEPGLYSLAFTLADGQTLAKGEVKITGTETPKPVEPQETLGGTLEKAFNKYAPKKQQE